MTANRLAAAGLALSLGLASASARAAPPKSEAASEAQTLAQALFDEAVALMDKGDYAAACPKLAESQRLDPGGGTLLNLGLCREKAGKLASAWTAYNEALSQAIKDGRKDREVTARQRVIALAPRLSMLVIDVPPPVAAIDGLEVRLDGSVVRQPAWGIAAPIDDGAHEIVTTAPGRVTRTKRVQIDAEGMTRHVEIDAPATDAPPVAPVAPEDRSSRRLGAYVTGAVGLTLVAVGGLAGGLALEARWRSDDACPGDRCTQRGVVLNEQAQTFAWISNVTLGVGIAALATGAVLLATSRSAPRSAAWIAPIVAPGVAGVAAARSF